jgi:hypothetical protein
MRKSGFRPSKKERRAAVRRAFASGSRLGLMRLARLTVPMHAASATVEAGTVKGKVARRPDYRVLIDPPDLGG